MYVEILSADTESGMEEYGLKKIRSLFWPEICGQRALLMAVLAGDNWLYRLEWRTAYGTISSNNNIENNGT